MKTDEKAKLKEAFQEATLPAPAEIRRDPQAELAGKVIAQNPQESGEGTKYTSGFYLLPGNRLDYITSLPESGGYPSLRRTSGRNMTACTVRVYS